MLNILEGYDLAAMGHNTAPYIHHLAEAMRRAYRDRAQFLADPDFVDVPVDAADEQGVRSGTPAQHRFGPCGRHQRQRTW
jgi:gamma-glutamyltranspeptidase